ncbi:MAG: SLBB domain-containing protein [Spirochaetaceae bacterium]|jgi:protein involved in polysaccharide export with SLBB domain|nr:SLBB domain-containing protein [Spirochaetaceae bacterium]
MRTYHIFIALWIIGAACPLAGQTSSSQTGQSNTGTSTRSLSSVLNLQSQSSGQSLTTPNPQLALSTPDYRVTAGDVYSLVYAAGTTSVEYTITVDSTYRVRISNLGVIDAAGKTYIQLKNQVETIVSNNYPLGGAQFVLRQPASFKVYIRGEVLSSVEVSAWALTRLSSLLQISLFLNEQNNYLLTRQSESTGRLDSTSRTVATDETGVAGQTNNSAYTYSGHNYLTLDSSIRNVSVRSSNGQVRVYDLFKADRLGDLSQDPYLRPDDVITVSRVERQITIIGEVARPGFYQLLRGEHLKQVIEVYANGFTPVANRTRFELTRYVNAQSSSGNKVFLKDQDITANYVLENYDYIFVPKITELQPVVFIEGAVSNAASSGASLTTSYRLVVPFSRGEYYGSLVRANRTWFSSTSDTKNSYIIRGDNQHIPINLNPMLYDEYYQGDIAIEENDTLIVPFRQYFVTVAGAVNSPGRYPYIPDRSWEYYVSLAGGLTPTRNAFEAVDIVDITGKKLKKTDSITPETTITAKSNNALYYINYASPVISAVATVVSLVISIITLNNMLK